MSQVREMLSTQAMIAKQLGSRAADRLAPIDNLMVAGESRRAPLVWVGGLTTRPENYLGYQRHWQHQGVPTWLVDTGKGLNPTRQNADNLRGTVEEALAMTGADHVWIGGQSKGTIDTRWALQHDPDLLDVTRGVFSIVGPHQGGLVADVGRAQALRGISERLPFDAGQRIRAATELLADSPELRELNDDFVRFMDSTPEGFRIDNFVTSATPRGIPDHDWLVPLRAQRLPGDHAKVIEHRLQGGALNHITAHEHRQVTRTMDEVMRHGDTAG